MSRHDLSSDQAEAMASIRTWLDRGSRTKPTLTLAGYAGTGKSYVVSILATTLQGPVAFCAFTGKAASVLARKLAAAGVKTTSKTVKPDAETEQKLEPRPYCGTIHGLVYRPCPECMQENDVPDHDDGPTCALFRKPRTPKEAFIAKIQEKEASKAGAPATSAPTIVRCLGCLAPPPPPPKFRDGPCRICGDGRYLRREDLDRPYRLIIVDEASMVSDDILETLLRHGVPILAVGDHGQLQPVRGTGSLMRSPDLRLEKIHRQAEGNPIIQLSARIRATGDIADELEDGEAITLLSRRKLRDWIEARFPAGRLALGESAIGVPSIMGTVLISWTNKLRVALNQDVRTALGAKAAPPSTGEVVVCLKNKPPIYNGMRAVLTSDGVEGGNPLTPKVWADLWFAEDSLKAQSTAMSALQFFEERTLDLEFVRERGVNFSKLGELYDFGYALTCHKMQGSQSNEVGIVLEPGLTRMGLDDRTRWIYTGVTRASERLTVIR